MILTRKHLLSFKMGIACTALLLPTMASAVCYKITANITDPNSVYYTEPGKGTAKPWRGSMDEISSLGTTPRVINLNNDEFQPVGTLLASGMVTIFEGGDGTFGAEQILYRCSSDEDGKLKEFYATNGDSTFAGHNLVDPSLGLDETYITNMSRVGIRLKNLTTGEYYSRYWKSRPLTDLEKDSKGWILVKAKNFSNTGVELFKIPTNRFGGVVEGPDNLTQPAGYIAFQSSNIAIGLADGLDSNSIYPGFYEYWPASSANMYHHITVRTAATCFVQNVTPYVNFPVISVSELASGRKETLPVNINFYCQTSAPATNNLSRPLSSGTGENQTAMGFLPQPTNVSKAVQLGLTVAGGNAITYLVTDGYDTDNNMAKGVGVRLYNSAGTPLNLLSTILNRPYDPNGAYNGWYPVLDGAEKNGTNNGLTGYTKSLTASFESIPGQKITAGRFSATLQAVIKVQ